MILDFDDLATVVEPEVVDKLDHTSLNDLMPNPTAEHIALWIWDALAARLPLLDEIVVWETPTACAVVTKDDARTR